MDNTSADQQCWVPLWAQANEGESELHVDLKCANKPFQAMGYLLCKWLLLFLAVCRVYQTSQSF